MEWKEFFKPTKWKIILSLIPLVLFSLMYFGVHVLKGDNFLVMILTIIFALLCIPFNFLLIKVGFGYPERWFIPLTDGGIFIVALIYGVLIYLIYSLLEE